MLVAARRPSAMGRAQPGGSGASAPWLTGVGAGVLVAVYAALRLLLERSEPGAAVLAVNLATAGSALSWLAALGTPLARDGTLLLHAQGFVAEVHATCTALLPAALLCVAVALHPRASPARRFIGMLCGVVCVVLVNQFRLVGVIWVGVHAPPWFELAHGWAAPVALVTATAAFVVVWARTVR